MGTLRVRPVAGRLAPDHDATALGVRRFVGRRAGPLPAEEHPGIPMHDRVRTPAEERFPMTEEPATISDRHEHVRMVLEGDLAPADEDTAKRCGVDWAHEGGQK